MISLIISLSEIIYCLDEIEDGELFELQKIILVAIHKYPELLAKYLPNFYKAMVELIKSLHAKCGDKFYILLKKIFSEGFKILLNYRKFNVNNDEDYYKMIKKTTSFWLSLINHDNWTQSTLNEFGNGLFKFLEYMIENLDISYKSNIQIEL